MHVTKKNFPGVVNIQNLGGNKSKTYAMLHIMLFFKKKMTISQDENTFENIYRYHENLKQIF